MADAIILATNKPVMPLDGFSRYPLTVTELASLVAQGKLRFLLMNQPQMPPQALDQGSQQGKVIQGLNGKPNDGHQDDVLTWVTQHCKAVPSSQWQSSSTSSSGGDVSGSNDAKLYDCAATH
jgi:pantothenate synthetase